jgi:hypothetical protein
MMNELNKLIGVGDLLKAADMMKAQLADLEVQLVDIERRITHVEEQDHVTPKFLGCHGRSADDRGQHSPGAEGNPSAMAQPGVIPLMAVQYELAS